MGLVSEGIDRVRVFSVPVGVYRDGDRVRAPRVAIVRWRSEWLDKLHQIYVGGRLGGTTLTCEQREMAIAFPSFGGRPVRVEVFAVRPADADIDFGEELEGGEDRSGRVSIRILRSQGLPAAAQVNIYSDGGTGEVNYEQPMDEQPVNVWAAWQDKAGFGMVRFGHGDFGFDSAAARGFGKGYFGRGQFGLDADAIEWTSAPLEVGTYRFGVKFFDEYGNGSEASELEVTINPAARPVERLEVVSFDRSANRLVLAMCADN